MKRTQGFILDGNFPAAARAAGKAYALAESTADKAMALAGLSGVHTVAGDLEAAQRAIDRAFELAGESDAAIHASISMLRANLEHLRGDPAQALATLTAGVERISKDADPAAPSMIHVMLLGALAAAYAETGQPRQALRRYQEAYALGELLRERDQVILPQITVDIALVHRDMGDWDRAHELAQEGLAAAARMPAVRGPALARLHVAAAVIKRRVGDTEGALALLEQVEEFWTTKVPPDHIERVSVRLNRAAIAADLGHHADARRLLSRLAGELPKGGNATAAGVLAEYNLALLEYKGGELPAARSRADALLPAMVSVFGPSHLHTATTQVLRACLLADAGDHEQALGLAATAIEAENHIQWTAFGAGGQGVRRAILDRLAQTLQIEVSLALSAPDHLAGSAIRTAFAAVSGRKGASREGFTALVGNARDSGTLAEFVQLSAQLLQLMTSHPDGAELTQLSRLLDRQEALESALADAVPQQALHLHALRATPERILAALAPGTALLEVFQWVPFDLTRGVSRDVGEAEYIGFLAANDAVRLVRLGRAADIDAEVGRWQENVAVAGRHEPPLPLDPRPMADLGAVLVEPLLAAIDEAGGPALRHLHIAPDGDLGLIPWELLPGEDGRALAENLSLSYLSTGRDVLTFDRERGEGSRALVMADPDFGPIEGEDLSEWRGLSQAFPEGFPPLPGTREEGETVARLLGGELRVGAAADRDALAAVRAPRVVHLATHGFFLPDPDPEWALDLAATLDPETRIPWRAVPRPLLRCGLALAGANTAIADAPPGIVTGEDIVGLDLRDTRLVVLSACDTGRGLVEPGEGVLNLAHAFTVAGARAVVLSLWKVHDSLGRRLMETFYARLAEGIAPLNALRLAQRDLRDRYPDPYCWAGFVLYGAGDRAVDPHAASGEPAADVT
ncbi:CHAT domain-containing protein [Microbispora sp. NPDC088329]|uniref:CHAT domain-containing protein n=1 Tax=Microbispora sp. NPDC088329 TaxID=3154869 RepID=UPI003414BE56